MDFFLEGLNILGSTFCVCADGFQGLSKASLIGCRENAKELTCHRRLHVCIFSATIAALGSLNRVTGMILKISK
jgi:hypothetical protein